MWIVFALLSAVFAALTSIFAKIGDWWSEFEFGNGSADGCGRCDVVVDGVYHEQSGLAQISKKSWVFLILSGLRQGRHGCAITERSTGKGDWSGCGG